jgi:hypothetical protein
MITGTAGNFLRGRCPCWLKSARRSVSSRLMPSSVAIASAQTPWRDCGCLARSRRLPEPATRRHRHLFGATCDYEILDAACNLTDAFRRRESEGAEKAVRQQRARSEGCLWRETLQSRPSTALARGVRSANRARASRRLGYFYFNEEQHQGRATRKRRGGGWRSMSRHTRCCCGNKRPRLRRQPGPSLHATNPG